MKPSVLGFVHIGFLPKADYTNSFPERETSWVVLKDICPFIVSNLKSQKA